MAKGGATLILDIDSASAGACVVTVVDGKPQVSLVKRVQIGSGQVRDTKALIPQLKEALATLMPDYTKVNPKNVLVVVASPWFSAQLRTLSSKSEKPVKITKSSIDHVVTNYTKTEAPGGHKLESIPITVLVNGYPTRVLSPVHGKTLSVTLYESTSDQQFIETVTTAVHTVAPHAKAVWHSTPLVYADTILSVSGDDSLTVVDVGGELSDVIVLSRGTIGFVGSVPEGARTIARAVAGGVEASIADSASRLTMLAKGDLADADMSTLATKLTEASKVWQKSFADILAEAGNTIPVPHRVVLVGERDELPWFERVVAGETTNMPAVVMPEFFKGQITFAESTQYDASLTLAALFFHMHYGGQQNQDAYKSVIYSKQ